MEEDELHEESNHWQVNIYLGDKIDKEQCIVREHGPEEVMLDFYNDAVNGRLPEIILAEIAANHIDMDPGWEHDDYVVELLDADRNEEASSKVRIE